MIELPTRRKLERRRDRLYAHLGSVLHYASVVQVENIMRQIHCINLRLRTYFKAADGRQTQEVFTNPEEDNDITTTNTTAHEVCPTAEELARIEAQICQPLCTHG